MGSKHGQLPEPVSDIIAKYQKYLEERHKKTVVITHSNPRSGWIHIKIGDKDPYAEKLGTARAKVESHIFK